MEAPDSKRQRIGSGPEQAWTNGHHNHRTTLPPIPGAPSPHSYSQPSPYSHSRPASGSHSHPHHLEERRHHEQDYPPALHEQRAMPGAPNGYGPYSRDSISKIESQPEPNHHSHQRPSSTGHSNDPHMALHVEDPRRYDGIQSQPPPYRPQQSYAPQVQTGAYDAHHPSYAPVTPAELYSRNPPPFTAVGSPMNGAPTKRKAPRTSQACGQCRTAKAKCDDPKPCTACRKANIECDFKPPEPKQADKIQAEILQHLSKLTGDMGSLVGRMSKVERYMAESTGQQLLPASPGQKSKDDEEMKDEYLAILPPTDSDGAVVSEVLPEFHADEMDMENEVDEDLENITRIIHPDLSPSIPVNHTTPASRMLNWPSISKHLGDIVKNDPKIRNFHYTTTREVKRGVLRLYGRGEGSDGTNIMDFDMRTGQTGEIDDAASEASVSPAAEHVWGPIGAFTPPTSIPIIRGAEDRRSGLDATNSVLELDESTVRKLASSYMRHMNIMHPIIFPGYLERLIKEFLQSLPEQDKIKDQPKLELTKKSTSSFIGDRSYGGIKRKQIHVENGTSPPRTQTKPAKPQRSIDTALLLVILALGKICEHRTKIPNCLPPLDPEHNQTGSRNGSYPSPNRNMSPQTSYTSSPMENERHHSFAGAEGRRSSYDSTTNQGNFRRPIPMPTARNLDVIPGLAYFATATDIIGNQLGGNTVKHVQAGISPLLVESYMNQLYLRKHLNEIHNELYKKGKEHDYKLPINEAVFKELRAKVTRSDQIIKGMQTLGHYRDSGEPAEIFDILNERLEAKKYGALNITYRPFLMMIMNREPGIAYQDIPQEIITNAEFCIYAMENSTRSFPMREGKRVIITNPWGTAHAQWGNVIALQAALMDKDLCNLIDRTKLSILIKKVLQFLNNIAQPSSSLAQDIKLLHHVAEKVTKLLPPGYQEPTPRSGPASSFGSVNGRSPGL